MYVRVHLKPACYCSDCIHKTKHWTLYSSLVLTVHKTNHWMLYPSLSLCSQNQLFDYIKQTLTAILPPNCYLVLHFVLHLSCFTSTIFTITLVISFVFFANIHKYYGFHSDQKRHHHFPLNFDALGWDFCFF